MDGFPENCRHARYRCVLAAARNGEDPRHRRRHRRRNHPHRPSRTAGFGYDPLFYIPDQNLTMAEIDPTTRLSLSHRGRALRALLDKLLPQLQPH